jgi:phytoene dehydrogenase-like protein
VRRMTEEHFRGEGGGLILAGCALHGDLSPETGTSGFFGWLLAGIGQRHGWPVPRTGAGALTDALVRRLRCGGGEVRCNAEVRRIHTRGGRAVAVTTADGERYEARRAVLADVVAPRLYLELLEPADVPGHLRSDLRRYQRALATFKVNWTLDGPVPWADGSVAPAGTVHLADSMDELTLTAAQLATGHLPSAPFVLVGQMTTSDPTRSPAGTESLWAYTNISQVVRGDAAGELEGLDSDDDVRRFADRLEDRIERHAPGFRSRIRGREIQTPGSLERDDANLLGGDKSLGTAQLHQQLIFRPTIGLARAETPIPGLFLASASAHPGGGVHGACGASAARAAIAADRRRRVLAPLARLRRAP